MTNTTTTTTRRRQRRHQPTSGETLAAMPDHGHAAPLDRCPGLPGIKMNGAHVFRHDEDGETRCTRCDLTLPTGLCLTCGATLYVSGVHGDLRDVSNGDARCTGRLLRSDDQPAYPYTGTAHVLRVDDPLAATVKPPTPPKKGAKVPTSPDVEDIGRRPLGIVCTTCRRRVYLGEGHDDGCSYKARSVEYNADLNERLLRADAIAQAERERRQERWAEKRARDDDDDGTPRPRRTRATGERRGGGGIPDDELCEGSGDAVVGAIEQRKFVRAARCPVCNRSVPVSPTDTYRRHRPGKGSAPRSPRRSPEPGVDVVDESVPEVVEDDAVTTTPAPAKKRSTKKAAPARTTTTTPKAAPKRSTKKHGRSALSAKAVVHAMKGSTPACGASIATIVRTADAVTCRTCAAQLAAD